MTNRHNNLNIPILPKNTSIKQNTTEQDINNNKYNDYWTHYNQYYNQHNKLISNLEKNIDYLGANLIKLSNLSLEKFQDLKKSNKVVNEENDELKEMICHLECKINDLEYCNKRDRETNETYAKENKKLKLIIKNPLPENTIDNDKVYNTTSFKYDYKKTKNSYSNEKIAQLKNSIKSINDIINLKEQFMEIRHDKELIRLYYCIDSLNKLNKMIGMDTIKNEIFKHIIYYIKNKENEHMLHTVITGSPGTGKTELGSILANIYLAIGALKKKTFKVVKRSDLIAGYLGQTAIKTQKIIDECDGGVLFIDEAYSLGNNEQRDSFSKECLDTINLNLTEKKNTFMCIIAGYPNELEKCFFAYNQGLERRFSFKYEIIEYTFIELKNIFMKKINENKLKININDGNLTHFFEKHYQKFKYFGGDIEKLLFYIKLESSTRCFQQNIDTKIILKDLETSIDNFNDKKDESKQNFSNMYL